MKRIHHSENFPVASRLLDQRHRPIILAFYNFVRTADDIADDPARGEMKKLSELDRLEEALLSPGGNPVAEPLRRGLEQRGMTARHVQDLLAAFRLDVIKKRYRNWSELIDYCTLSAMPVGRFVLDVHGESASLWRASDALCAALQIINHLQDCIDDYRNLDRVYLPLDILAAHGASVEDLRSTTVEGRVTPPLRASIASIAAMTRKRLLKPAADFAPAITSLRLSLEVEVIHSLADVLLTRLARGDPLRGDVRLGKAAFARIATRAVLYEMGRRAAGRAFGPDVVEAGR